MKSEPTWSSRAGRTATAQEDTALPIHRCVRRDPGFSQGHRHWSIQRRCVHPTVSVRTSQGTCSGAISPLRPADRRWELPVAPAAAFPHRRRRPPWRPPPLGNRIEGGRNSPRVREGPDWLWFCSSEIEAQPSDAKR